MDVMCAGAYFQRAGEDVMLKTKPNNNNKTNKKSHNKQKKPRKQFTLFISILI